MNRHREKLSSVQCLVYRAMLVFFGCIAIGGCGRSETTTASTASSPPPATASGVELRADPNPIPADGSKTRTCWSTGPAAHSELYAGNSPAEKLVARGARGAKEIAWIRPGATTAFTLCKGGDRKELLARLSITQECRTPQWSKSPPGPSGTPSDQTA